MAKPFSVSVEIGGKVLPTLDAAVRSVEGKLNRLSKSAAASASRIKGSISEIGSAGRALAGLAAAGGIVASVKHAIGAGAELQHELQALKNAGRTAHEVADAMAAANDTMKQLPTASLTDSIKVLNETTGAFGDFHHALENLTFNQRIGGMLKNILGDKAGDPGKMFNDLVRGMEIRGAAGDAARYQREVEGLYKAFVFTRGNFNPGEFLNFAQQANPSIKTLSEHFLTRVAPSLIQEFGGDKAGTRLQAFENVINGKVRDKTQTAAWMKLGLIDPKQVVGGKGSPLAWRAGAVKGTDLANTDPDKWAEQVMLPALQKSGVNIDDQLALSKALATLFRNNESNRFAQAIMQANDRRRLKKDDHLIGDVHGSKEAYDDTLENDPHMALDALKASVESLSAALTLPVMKTAAGIMAKIARGITMIAGALQKNPEMATRLTKIGAALALFSALRLFNAATGLLSLARGLVMLGASATLGLASRLLRVARGILMISAAASAGAFGRLAKMALGLRMLSTLGKGAVFGGLISSMGRFGKALLLFPMTALRGLATGLVSILAASGVGAIVLAIVAALAALGVWVWNNWDGIKEFCSGFADGFMKALPPPVRAAFEALGTSLKNIFEWLGKVLGPLDASKEKWHGWGEAAGAATGRVVGFIAELPGKIAAYVVEFGSKMKAMAQGGYDALVNFNWRQAGTDIVMNIIAGVENMGADFVASIRGLGSRAAGAFNSAFGFGGGDKGSGGAKLPGRAVGGPVRSGMPYIVGERGPELFVPNGHGNIETNSALRRAGSLTDRRGPSEEAMASARSRVTSSTNYGDTHVTVNLPAGSDRDVARQVAAAVREEMRKGQSRQRGLLSD